MLKDFTEAGIFDQIIIVLAHVAQWQSTATTWQMPEVQFLPAPTTSFFDYKRLRKLSATR